MDIDPEDETSYTTLYQDAFVKYVENEYCAKYRRLPVNKLEIIPSSNLIPSAMASRFCETSFDPHGLSSDDDEHLTPINVAETTPGWSDCAAHQLTATRFDSNSPSGAPMTYGQINPNLNDYHSDLMESSSALRLPDITDWWRQQEQTHSKYAGLSNVAPFIYSTIPHGVRVEASFALGRDVIGWRHLQTTGKTHRREVVVRKFAQANNRISVADNPLLDTRNTENDSEMKNEVEERKFHRMAKVHDCLEMWQGSQTYVLLRTNLALKSSK